MAPPGSDWAACFQASREAGREGQAYLIEGDAAGPALDLAVRILQTVLCERQGVTPCGACRACAAVAERRHADVQWLEPESKSRQILIDAVRDRALHAIRTTSYSGGWKGVVILQADRLNIQAANALLKALEEPPPRTLLLLITAAPGRLPDTLVSRCRRLRVPGEAPALDPEARETVLARLAQMAPDAGAVEGMAVAGAFTASLAAWRADAEKQVAEEDPESDEKVRAARIETRSRQTALDLLRLIEQWQRDLLLCATGAPEAIFSFPAHKDALRRQAAGLSTAEAMRRIEAVENAQRRLDLNMALEVVLDGCFQTIARRTKRPLHNSADLWQASPNTTGAT